jgi:hypothetical protein
VANGDSPGTGGVPGGPDAGGSVPGGTGSPGTTGGTGPTGTGSVPGGTGTSVQPAGNGEVGLSPGEMAVLRKIATDASFRLLFANDPLAAITGAGLKITTRDYERLQKLTAAQLEQVAQGLAVLAGASGASGLSEADGTHTLVYAIIVALLLAAQEPEATA